MFGINAEKSKLEWTSSTTYGKISKYAAADSALVCSAKTLYALVCIYGGRDGVATPKLQTLCKDLNIGKKKVGELLFELSSQGYIEIIKEKSNGRFTQNKYKIVVCPAKYNDMVAEDSKEAYALEKIKAGGIQSYGYGLVELRVLRDRELHIIAKAIYIYFCAFSGNTSTAYPSIKAILTGLKISESTYYKYIKQLIAKKYVQVIEHKTIDGKYSPNEYVLLGHPNRFKPSNYEANIAAVNKKTEARRGAKKDASPSPKSDAQPYPKNDARCKNKKGSESGAEPSDSQVFAMQPFTSGNSAEPSVVPPFHTSPFPKTDALYNINNINTNNQKKNTLNQGTRKKLEKNKFAGNINQSKKSKSFDSIDKPANEAFMENSDKVYNDLLSNKAIPMSCLKNKPALAFVIKTLFGNTESSAPKMSESTEEFLIRKGLKSKEPENTQKNPFRKLVSTCLVNMLHDTGNPYRAYAPEKVAGFINAHIRVGNGVATFDNWLDQFEKSFMRYMNKPGAAEKINNIYPYTIASLYKFLATYDDMYFHVKTDPEAQNSASESDDLFEKLVRKSLNF